MWLLYVPPQFDQACNLSFLDRIDLSLFLHLVFFDAGQKIYNFRIFHVDRLFFNFVHNGCFAFFEKRNRR